MIITTLPTYPNKEIIEDLGMIYAYDDRITAFCLIEDSIEECKKQLIKKAEKRGANAILSMSFVPHDSMHILMCGEAVIIKDI